MRAASSNGRASRTARGSAHLRGNLPRPATGLAGDFTRGSSCPLPEARLPIVIELPSGARLEATTDVAGFVEVALPPDERDMLVVRGAGVLAQVTVGE